MKQIMPPPLWRLAGETRDAVRRGLMWPGAALHPRRRESIRRLGQLQGIHQGQRGFIIGNGPSLRNTDLSRLKPETTFGLNRIYLLFPQLGFETSYYLSINSLVIEQCAREIQSLPMPKFLAWRGRRHISSSENTIFLFTTYTGPKFARDVRGRLWEGATVTYVALQLAFFLGFEQVILIGVDHSFSSKGKPNQTIVSRGDDPDHFHPAYFGKGFRWQLPDLETSERAFRMARAAYERAGRQVLDATIGGRLTVFPKIEYDSLF